MRGAAGDAVRRGPAPRRLADAAVLLAAIGVGAFLRFDDLGGASYWLDEILHQELTTWAATQPWWRWLRSLHEEHGGLYYLLQLATRWFGDNEAWGRSAAALAGVITIPVIWLTGRTALDDDGLGGHAAAILLAVSPLHVYFSREARGYSMLALLATILILAMLRARSLKAVALTLAALLYISAAAVPIVAATAIVAACAALLAADRARRRWMWSVAAMAALTIVLFRLLYTSKPVADASWPRFPALDAEFFSTLLRTFTVTSIGGEQGGRLAVVMLVLAVAGAAVLARRRHRGVVIVGLASTLVVLPLAALWFYDHFYAARYVSPALPALLLLVAAGISGFARMITGPLGRSRWAVAAAAFVAVGGAALMASHTWAAARSEPFRKLDWRAVASAIAGYAHPDDLVVAAEQWPDVSLRYYLARVRPELRLVSMPHVPVAEILLGEREAVWIVTAGGGGEMRGWACVHPVVLASPLESFRLHFASRKGDFVTMRGGAPELRAFSAALGSRGFTLHMTSEESELLGSGWAGIEGTGRDSFRWIIGTKATLRIPRWGSRARVIRARVMPLHHQSLAPQTIRVLVNGAEAGRQTLLPGWSELSMPVPAGMWRDGMNAIEMQFARAVAPRRFDAASPDERELAAAVDWISFDDEGAPSSLDRDVRPSLRPLRLASLTFLDERTAWKREETRFPRAHLDRVPVEELLGRLGWDPLTAWPKLASGAVRLDDAIETIAYGSECDDDRLFLRRAFTALLDRVASPAEERELLAELRRGAPRQKVAARIARSVEFREKVMTHDTAK